LARARHVESRPVALGPGRFSRTGPSPHVAVQLYNGQRMQMLRPPLLIMLFLAIFFVCFGGCNAILTAEWAKVNHQNEEVLFLKKQSKEGLVLLKRSSTDTGPGNIQPNDLWAIHDMLLLGYHAVFMKPDTAGSKEVQRASIELANMLPELHPVEACRKQIETAISGQNESMQVLRAAEASWSCLPAKFTETSFTSAFVGLHESREAYKAAKRTRMPHLEPDDHVLGACKDSRWPRTCSYWSSMHLLSYRADRKGKGQQFLAAIVPLIAGGMTLCQGCTMHFRVLNAPALSDAFRTDATSGF